MRSIRHVGLGMVLLLVLAACGDNDASGDDASGNEAASGTEDAARFCELTAQMNEAAASGTPDAFENMFKLQMAIAEEALSVVPADIRSDFEALIAREVALSPLMESSGFDPTKFDDSAVQAVNDEYPIPDGAGLRIGRWEDSNC